MPWVPQAIRGCILCPSRELARQTAEVLASLTNSCQVGRLQAP